MDTTSLTGGYAAPGIRTFLIADVRGYTYFTQEHGDESAAKLAGKFAAVTREVVEGHGGEAAAHAIDRQALAGLWKLAPADQVLPASMPGFRDNDFYWLDGPDVGRARALMDRRRGAAIMGIFRDCFGYPCLQAARFVRTALAKIGIRVRIEAYENPWDAARDPATPIDIIDAGSGGYDPDPARLLRSLVFESPPTRDWFPSGIQTAARRMIRLEGPARAAAAANLADRLVNDDVAVAAYGEDVVTALLSPRLRCRVFPPLGYGIDLAALCLNES
jgi:class 3 adenylate cyclase